MDASDELLLVQLDAGRQQAERVTVRCGDLCVNRQSFALASILRGAAHPGRLIVGWFEQRTAGVSVAGRSLGADQFFVIRDDGLDICASGSARLVWLDLDASSYGRELGDGWVLASGASFAIGEQTALWPLRTPLDRAAAAARDTGDLDTAVRRVLRGAVTSLKPVGRPNRYDIVRTAEAFMWEHVDETLSIDRVATAISRSRRTVVNLFHGAFGMGPISYFKTHRLNAVRRDLERRPSGRRIADIAADYAFWHMGHFGSDYRMLFGETPSETRRRCEARL